jgi:hypothetical protein
VKTRAVAYTLYCGRAGPAHREGTAGVAEEVPVSVDLVPGTVPVDPQADQTGATGNNLSGRAGPHEPGGRIDASTARRIMP